MSDLTISLLGSFSATLDQQPITHFRTKSVQALLIYLVCEAKQPQQREQLMTLLWPDMPLASAQANMRQTVYRLRKLLPQVTGKDGETAVPFIITNRTTIQINPDARYFLDVDRFVQSDPRQAIDLYRGDFLADFYLPNNEMFEDWARQRRIQYRRQVLQMLDTVTAVHLQQAQFNEAAQLAQRQLEIDNLRESSHRQLIEAWARNGRRQEALTHYDKLCQLLQDELAIEPEPETISLIEAIRLGASTIATQNQPDDTLPVPLHNLPERRTSFIGRSKELKTITHLISHNQLVTLTGVGGVGKTNLTLQVGQALLSDFPDGVWFIELAPVTDPDLIWQTAVYALGLRETSNRPLPELLLNFLRKKQCLLIVDNCEHLLQAAAIFVEKVMQACPHVKILTSSREQLAIEREIQFQVPPLTFPDKTQQPTLAEWAHYDAVRLFVERATAVLPNYRVTTDNFHPLIQICQQLDGIPLALELAAARVNLLTTKQIAERLSDRFRLLNKGSKIALPRQQTLRALIDWSWDLLTTSEQELLQRVSVFIGGAGLEAVEGVCAGNGLDVHNILDLLTELTNKSLIVAQRTPGKPTRYQLLETIRQYAQEKLTASGQQDALRQHHLNYFQQVATALQQVLVGPDQVACINQLERELDNIRAALTWAQVTDNAAGVQLITTMWRFWDSRYAKEGEVWLAELLGTTAFVSPDIKAKAYWVRARFNFHMADFDNTRTMIQKSLALYETLENPAWIARCRVFMSLFIEWEKSQPVLLESLSQFRKLGDDLGVAETLLWLGYFEGEQNNYEQANAYLQESLSLYRELGHLIGMADTLNFLAEHAIWKGDYVGARPILDEGLAIEESLGSIRSSNTLRRLGLLHYRLGEYHQAKTYLEKSLALSQRTGEFHTSCWALADLGYVYLRDGSLTKANRTFIKSLRQFKELGNKDGLCFTLEGLASLAVSQRQAVRAIQLFAWANELRAVMQNPRPLVEEADVKQDLSTVKEMTDEETYAAAYTVGQVMTLEEAINYGLEYNNSVG